MFNGPYSTMFPDLRKLIRDANKPVAHRETCPDCGRTLVNVYRHGKVWRCRKCWEAEDAKAQEGKATQ